MREGVPPRRSKVPQLHPREVHRVRPRPAPQDRAATRPRSAPPRRGEARGAGSLLRRSKVIARPASYPTLKSPTACMLTGYIAYCTGSSKRPVTCRAPRLDIQSTASVRDDPFSQYTTTYTDARSLTTNPRKTRYLNHHDYHDFNDTHRPLQHFNTNLHLCNGLDEFIPSGLSHYSVCFFRAMHASSSASSPLSVCERIRRRASSSPYPSELQPPITRPLNERHPDLSHSYRAPKSMPATTAPERGERQS